MLHVMAIHAVICEGELIEPHRQSAAAILRVRSATRQQLRGDITAAPAAARPGSSGGIVVCENEEAPISRGNHGTWRGDAVPGQRY